MSAFLCSERHLAAIAAWAGAQALTDDPVALCITLRRLNNAAMAARYGYEALPLQDLRRAMRQAWAEGTRTHAEALALLTCPAYQCSEGNVMEAHPDRGVLLALLNAATAAAPGGKATPHLWAID
jgi:hypothetical protein